jgi:hypothetical protein
VVKAAGEEITGHGGQSVTHEVEGQLLALLVAPTGLELIEVVPGVGVKAVAQHGRTQHELDLFAGHALAQLVDLLLFHIVALGNIDAIDQAATGQGEGGQGRGNQVFHPHIGFRSSIQSF